MTRIVVVLPAPLGPKKPRIRPGGNHESCPVQRHHVAVPFMELSNRQHDPYRRFAWNAATTTIPSPEPIAIQNTFSVSANATVPMMIPKTRP